MRALVTGGGGFLGRHVVAELIRRGDEPRVVLRPSREEPAEFADAKVELARFDLRRPGDQLDRALDGVDAVYNLAAGVAGNWRATFDNNVGTTENLVDAVSRTAWTGRLVHVSSFSVYGLNQLRRGATVDERTSLEPHPERRDDYAWAKLWQERVINRLTDGPAELAIVRPGAIYGRERRFQWRLGRLLGEDALILLGGDVPVPLNYVENTASLLAECGRHPSAAGEVFNAVDEHPPTQREYVDAWRAAGGPKRVIRVPLAVPGALGSALALAGRATGGKVSPPAFVDPYVMGPTFRQLTFETSKASRLLGWRQPVSRDEAFRRTFAD